jgi:hypothetical protein
MAELDPLYAETTSKQMKWEEHMEDQIADMINNLNPGLTAKDYSLNSPLIRDRVDAVLLKLQTGQTTTQFAHNKQLLQSGVSKHLRVTWPGKSLKASSRNRENGSWTRANWRKGTSSSHSLKRSVGCPAP